MAGVLNRENWNKAVRYLKKNGIKDTFFASWERLYPGPFDGEGYQEPTVEICREQRQRKWDRPVKISILVPAYETDPEYLDGMLQSVLDQTYENWELVLADASCSDTVEKKVKGIRDPRICYIRLPGNAGISGNSNYGLKAVTGEYTALLDHDDLLTKDALYEVADLIERSRKKGIEKEIIYSDEDKCDGTGKIFYEIHKKPKFDPELLLSNNYFCHLLVLKSDLIRKLGFRKEYDGAQDYDLVLRAVAEVMPGENKIGHIGKVLYHWRCHRGSTALNTDSKQYAYEAGRKALADFAWKMGWDAEAVMLKHLGFYRLDYRPDYLSVRTDVGIVGGCILDASGKICGGAYTGSGKVLYKGLYREFSGYMHRACLRQEVPVTDVRLMRVNRNLIPILEEMSDGILSFGADGRLLTGSLPENADFFTLSKKICLVARSNGYRVIWEPDWKEKIK